MAIEKKVKVKGHCPQCGPDRWTIIKGEFTRNESQDDISVSTDHRILQCPACETVYHQTNMTCSEDYDLIENEFTGETEFILNEDIKHWPPPTKRQRPAWLDKLPTVDTDLYRLLRDVYSALDADLDVLAAIGIRTTFDRGSELLSVDPAKTFKDKIDDLVIGGHIGANERDALSIMTEAGNASAHRGWKPTEAQLETMLQIIESFVHRSFILKADITKLRNAVPAKPKRKP
ncbi:DUF4145 domain-containing protein [Nitrobacter sp. JJSN]|uniref:DUF4145 domain-containing protein n=1 Tax=Nitrobacter sp. JJSN TaxID=3453033 RepID=UPI003F778006